MVYLDNFVVAIKCDDKILREKNNVVFMPFGTEYSILLKNLDSRKAVVDIFIDGKTVVGDKRIIVQPNSSVELEGYKQDSKVRNKFKFIKKTKEIIEHRGDRVDDGIIRVEVTFEKKVKKEIKKYEEIWKRIYIPWTNYWGSYPIYNDNKTKVDWTYMSNTLSCVADSSGSNTVNKCCFSSSEPLDDEGITVKGSDTKQDFVVGYTKDLEEESSVIIIRLKGTNSEKMEIEAPITVDTKLECSSCGKKFKSSANYCDQCGTKL